MSWSSSRSAAGAAVRERAHSDDAKHRTHDATNARPPFPKWTLPVAAGAAVVVVIGGTSAVLASRHTTRARQSAASHEQKNTSAGPEDQADDPTQAPATPQTGVAGRSFTITGTWHGVSAPLNGYPGSTTNLPGITFQVTCESTSCTVSGNVAGHVYKPLRLPAVGANVFRGVFPARDPDARRRHLRMSESLAISGKRARLVYKEPGFASPSMTLHPFTATLAGPVHFTD